MKAELRGNVMKRTVPLLLCFLLLSSCGKIEEPAVSEDLPIVSAAVVSPSASPAETPPAEPAFEFTADNYPRVDGSTATIPLIGAVESVLLGKPRAEVTVNVSKTSQAYWALADERADLLLVYDGGDETREQVNADTLFETVPIGKDALVFVVNKDNPIDNLTTEQVRKIFSGEYKNWNELGGNDEKIRAYQRGIGSGSQALMDKLVMKELPMADTATIKAIGDMGGLIDAVANYAGGPTGIGYNVYFYVTEMNKNDDIKILKIDGVDPNYSTIQSGDYPFVRDFYSVIRKSEPQDSPARALHEWMLSKEAQNLMVSENYVALYADPSADTPVVDGEFSFYPAGEAPAYLKGVNRYALQPSDSYGELYFYLGAKYYDREGNAYYYGLCTADGKIVTEPVYTTAELLTDSNGNKAYLCYRSDIETSSEIITTDWGTYEKIITPALLFATDGSWVLEFEGAEQFYGYGVIVDIKCNADFLAVKKNGKWGAVNLLGETVISFDRDSYAGMYDCAVSGDYNYFAVTADRFIRSEDDKNDIAGPYNLYDGSGRMLATGLRGWLSGMAGEYIITNEQNGNISSVYTYTLDGELIASLSSENGNIQYYASPLGSYIRLYKNNNTLICDEHFNIIYEMPIDYDAETDSYRYYESGPGVLYKSNVEELIHRTYLPDGTRLVTWYDPGMNEWERGW